MSKKRPTKAGSKEKSLRPAQLLKAANEKLLLSALEQDTLAETERRHADEARSLLVSIVESSADSIISINFDAIVTSWNQAAELLYGYRAEEVLGKSLTLLTLPEDLKEILARIDKVKQSKSVELFETERIGANGVPLWLSVQLSPIKNAQGKVMGVSTIARDITGRKKVEDALALSRDKLSKHTEKLEQQIAERIADLKTTNEQLESFVYSIAHDLRAPLRAMQGFSQALLEEYAPHLDEMGRNYLSRINVSSEFMDKMIIDLLAFGRAGRLEVALQEVSVTSAWNAALFQCDRQIQQSGAQIETVPTLPSVCAHEATLTQVLANLLSNGLKFMSPDTQPKIRFWAEDHGPSMRLWLEDNGVGIAPELHERVFRVFERLHGARFSGTGIGLSIVRKGIERMDGKVGLESEPGKGTKFWIELQKA